ncbi:MAG: hypothetical protein QOH76_1006 [Thermoleophilaceae bacterium]|nr:hypothetical protein [Thermoleophilaceae bacterium]
MGLVAVDQAEGLWYLAVGAPLTAAVGALVDRGWALLAPVAVTVVLGVLILALGSSCSDCRDEDGLGLFLTILFVLYTLPAMAALTAGMLVRRLVRFFRDLPPGEQHA